MANTPLPPMTVGNVVSAGLRLYRDRFSTYFPIGVKASLWAVIPFVTLLPIPFFIGFELVNPAILWAFSPIWLILSIFGLAQAITNQALICRLAFGVLINKPETVKEASAHVMPKIWKFWLAYFLALLLLMLVTLGFGLVMGLAWGIIVGIFMNQEAAPLVYGIFGLFSLAIIVVFLVFYIRFAIGFSLIQASLAMEQNLTPWQAMQRSQKLAKGYAGKIFTIFIVAGLLSLPLQILANFLVEFIRFLLIFALNINEDSPLFITIYVLLSYTISILIGLVLVPFYQIIQSIIYYDLCSRKEGLDIQLSHE